MPRRFTYGSVDEQNHMVDDYDKNAYNRWSTKKLLIISNGLMFGVVCICAFSMHATFNKHEQLITSLSDTVRLDREHFWNEKSSYPHDQEQWRHMRDQERYFMTKKKYDTETYFKQTLPLPSKFAIDHVTPLKAQLQRGTCWDFATIGVLEQTYREQGIRNGYLAHDEYVAFSEQAYGAEILRLCRGGPNSAQQKACRVAGDSIWHNSTEGGEVADLFYLVNGLDTNIFPHDICPYFPNQGQDNLCPGLESRRADNPLRFTVKDMRSYYDIQTAKQHFFEKKTAMALTTSMPYITHYYPCIGNFSTDPHCDVNSPHCALCPPELSMSTCCIPLPGAPNYNLQGEFIAHRGMTLLGGHALILVGYNDDYRTKDGFTGGFIVKNSWEDSRKTGSHSMQYWMREISDWEERTICPNSYSPYSWYSCGNGPSTSNTSYIPDGDQLNKSRAFAEGIGACLSQEARLYSKINVQPLHLTCSDARFCNTSPEYTYFLRNMTDWGDQMKTVCMWEYHQATNASRNFCLMPMLVLKLSEIFEPIQNEVRLNDPDRCGFYFYPYEVGRQYMEHFEGFFVNSFDIEWHRQSYAANRDEFSELNYSLLLSSTKKQNKYGFIGPLPYATVVSPRELNKEL